MAGYTYAPSTIIAETPIPYRKFNHGLNLKKYLPSIWKDLSPQERIDRIIIEQRYKSTHLSDGWEDVIFDPLNWHDDDNDADATDHPMVRRDFDDEEIIDRSEPQATFFNN